MATKTRPQPAEDSLTFRESQGGLPTNPIQKKCFMLLRKEGFEVARRAFPHFAAWNPKTKRFVLVICRKVRGRQTRRDQKALASLLLRQGIEVLFFDVEKGFSPMKLEAPEVKKGTKFVLPPPPAIPL